jgi:hypothetical protein
LSIEIIFKRSKKVPFINEPARKTPLAITADVVVIGGGPAGSGAAIRAAQGGADTVLIERFGSPGGSNTNGFMFISAGGPLVGKLCREIWDKLKPGGFIVNTVDKYPDLFYREIVHYRAIAGAVTDELMVYDPDMTAYMISESMQEAGVKQFLRTLFVDTIVENGAIKAVIVENASGRQAIEGKVFIDATGRGDVVARIGAPFTSAGDEMGFPMPAGLMWKICNADIDKLLEYEKKEDPGLDKVIEKAIAKGEAPSYYRQRKIAEDMKGSYDHIYTGHPRPEMQPTMYPGELLMWEPSIHEWGINAAESVEDLTRAEIHIRKQIVAEFEFLKKYVLGFKKAHLGGFAPMLGIREGRHPIGEYVLTYEDIINDRKFDDTAIRLTTYESLDVTKPELGRVQYNVPYRTFLAKKVNNLFLTGDNISADHSAFIFNRGFPKAMTLGEVAGTAAALSVKNKISPKQYNFPTQLL